MAGNRNRAEAGRARRVQAGMKDPEDWSRGEIRVVGIPKEFLKGIGRFQDRVGGDKEKKCGWEKLNVVWGREGRELRRKKRNSSAIRN